jgi:hypothetical protein
MELVALPTAFMLFIILLFFNMEHKKRNWNMNLNADCKYPLTYMYMVCSVHSNDPKLCIKKKPLWPLVCKRTIPTERLPLVGDI